VSLNLWAAIGREGGRSGYRGDESKSPESIKAGDFRSDLYYR